MAGQIITIMVKNVLHLWLLIYYIMVVITFMVSITFMVVITFMGDTAIAYERL